MKNSLKNLFYRAWENISAPIVPSINGTELHVPIYREQRFSFFFFHLDQILSCDGSTNLLKKTSETRLSPHASVKVLPTPKPVPFDPVPRTLLVALSSHSRIQGRRHRSLFQALGSGGRAKKRGRPEIIEKNLLTFATPHKRRIHLHCEILEPIEFV